MPSLVVAPLWSVLRQWEYWLFPASAAALLALLSLNARRPGATAAWLRTCRALSRGACTALGVVLAAGTNFVYSWGLGWLRLLLAHMVVLVETFLKWPDLPAFLAAALGIAFISAHERRGASALTTLAAWWRARPRGMERWLRRERYALAAAVAAAVLARTLFPSAVLPLFQRESADAQRYNYYLSYFNYLNEDARIVAREGMVAGAYGLSLPPGGSGQVIYRFERTPASVVRLNTSFYNRLWQEPGMLSDTVVFGNRLELSADSGSTWQLLAADRSLGQVTGTATVELTPSLGAATSYLLRFSADNRTPHAVTVLPMLAINTVTDLHALPSAAFSPLLHLLVASVLLTLLLRRWLPPRWEAAAAAVAVLLFAAAAVTARGAGLAAAPAGTEEATAAAATAGLGLPPAAFDHLWGKVPLWIVALSLVADGTWRWGRTRKTRPELARAAAGSAWAAAAVVVVMAAFDARYDLVYRLRFDQLLPDAQGYKHWAESIPQKMAQFRLNGLFMFYVGAFFVREPLWIFVVHWFFDLLGASVTHIRLVSLVFSVAVVALTYRLGRRVLHPSVGVLGALLVGFNEPHIRNSALGLREELGTLLFLLLISLLFVYRSPRRAAGTVWAPADRVAPAGWGARPGTGSWRSWWRPMAVGGLSAALVLTRSEVLTICLFLITAGALLRGWGGRAWVAAVAVLLVLIAPLYLGYWHTHGDPFFPATYGATVNRNIEFPERVGTPGFPTEEEYRREGWFSGPRIGVVTYFFGYHTLVQFVSYSIRGFIRIFPTVIYEHAPLMLWLFAAGALLMFATGRWLVPLLVVVLLAPPYAFLAGVPNPFIFPGRYAHHVIPLTSLASAYAVLWLPLALARIPSWPLWRSPDVGPVWEWLRRGTTAPARARRAPEPA